MVVFSSPREGRLTGSSWHLLSSMLILCQNRVRRRDYIIAVSLGCFVSLRTSSFRSNWYHLMPSSIRRHHWSSALINYSGWCRTAPQCPTCVPRCYRYHINTSNFSSLAVQSMLQDSNCVTLTLNTDTMFNNHKLTVQYVFKTNGVQSSCQYIRHEVGRRQTRKSLYLVYTECRNFSDTQYTTDTQVCEIITDYNWKFDKTIFQTHIWTNVRDKYLEPLTQIANTYTMPLAIVARGYSTQCATNILLCCCQTSIIY